MKKKTHRKCLFCKEKSKIKDGIVVPVGFFCSFEHIQAYASQQQLKMFKKEKAKSLKKARKIRSDVRKLNRKSLKWQHRLTQIIFNRVRVLQEFEWFKKRGMEPSCISCGKTLGLDQWCCGHFKTIGAHPELRYSEKNTFLQHNHRCNQRLSGDIGGTKKTRGFRAGILERFGEVEGKSILDYCEDPKNHLPKNYTPQELESMRKNLYSQERKMKARINEG